MVSDFYPEKITYLCLIWKERMKMRQNYNYFMHFNRLFAVFALLALVAGLFTPPQSVHADSRAGDSGQRV